MAVAQELSRFVRDALSAGKSRAEIAQVLSQSGWSRSEVEDAMNAWAETAYAPPVPRPQATVSARDFFIYALTFGLMISGATYLVQLLHALIDLRLEESTRPSSRIRWAMAGLIVTTPIYLWLTLRERGKLARDPALYRSAIRGWLMYLTLLLSATVMLDDAVAVIHAFLSGGFTLQFLLKAGVIAGIAALIFTFYLTEVRKGDAP